MTISIMMDLETWGTTPGSDIRSIGAVVFDPHSGTVGYTATPTRGDEQPNANGSTFYIACDNPVVKDPSIDHDCSTIIRKYPLTRDPQTVQWWSEQSDEAQAAFADPVDLHEGLQRFGDWLDNVLRPPANGTIEWIDAFKPWENLNLRLWSHGAAADPTWLAAAYRAVGLPVPWHYRAPRDTRTIFDAAGIDDHSAWLAQHPGPLGLQHHALDDAICQARAVCAAMARIGSVSDTQFDEISGAMVNLSALMQRAGFFDDDHNHAAYERVVKLWQNAIGHPDRNW